MKALGSRSEGTGSEFECHFYEYSFMALGKSFNLSGFDR